MKNILITREEKLDKNLENLSSKKGLNIIYCPLIKTTSVDFKVPDLKNFDYLIITSKNAVKFFLEKAENKEIFNKPVIAVGEKTKKYLKSVGFKNVIVPKVNSADGIKEILKEERYKDKKFLFLRAEKGRNIEGNNIDLLVVYKTVYNRPDNINECIDLLNKGKVDYIIFSSPSTFYSFKENFKNYKEVLEKTKIVSIGNTTKKAIEEEGFKVYFTPEKPSFEDIITLL